MSTETNGENCENYENYKNESIIKINWSMLSRNPEAIHLLEQYPDRICWKMLCTNPSPAAIRLLVQNQDKIYWDVFSLNPGAIPLLEAYPDKIHWSNLSSNPSEAAFRLLEKNQDKIDWSNLSGDGTTCSLARTRLFKSSLTIGHTIQLNQPGVLTMNVVKFVSGECVSKNFASTEAKRFLSPRR